MSNDKTAAADLVTVIPKILKDKTCSGEYTLDVVSYAGYVNVDSQKENYLYYWFFESRNATEDNVADIPLVIWLNGGPGASSLAGLFLENGPFQLQSTGENQAEITDNEYGWNQRVHLLYWDQPVGAGFSYTDTGSYAKSEQELCQQFVAALLAFFERHGEYRSCELYITGESYAGKYIPNMAKAIKDTNPSLPADKKINLKGLALGDGWMYPWLQTKLQVDYAYEMGFVDTLQKDTAATLYQEYTDAMDRQDWPAAFNLGNNVSNLALNCGGNPDIYDVRRWSDLPFQSLKDYLSCDNAKAAIHATTDWKFADSDGPVAKNLINDLETDVTGLFPELVKAYRMLFYTGNFDMSCGYAGTEQILQSLNYDGLWGKLIRKVWTETTPFASGPTEPFTTFGYIKGVGNLTQVVIPGAGHEVPAFQPKVSLRMLNAWVFEQDVPGYLPATVQAKTKWKDTGISISGDVKTTVTYLSGTWLASPEDGFTDAAGKDSVIAKPGYTLPGQNEGALCGRIGEAGEVFLIGKQATLPSGVSGNLFLCINDDLDGEYGPGFADNEGSVTVGVVTEVDTA